MSKFFHVNFASRGIRDQYIVCDAQSKCQSKENLEKYKKENNKKQQVPNQIFSKIVAAY